MREIHGDNHAKLRGERRWLGNATGPHRSKTDAPVVGLSDWLCLTHVVAAYPSAIRPISTAAVTEVAIPVRFDRIQPDIPKLASSA